MEKVRRALPILKRKRDAMRERPGLDDKVSRRDVLISSHLADLVRGTRCLERLDGEFPCRSEYHLADVPQISALAKASMVLPSDRYLIADRCVEVANRVVSFIRTNMWDEASRNLTRSWREGRGPTAQTDDYAFLVAG